VIEESAGTAALARYESDRPGVVMLDLLMSDMYGLDVLIALRRIDPGARVIIASADVQVATRDEVLAAGACAFVGKPFAADAVLGAVASALVPDGGAR
jgi:two-component system chemotaxis response regulator CheY